MPLCIKCSIIYIINQIFFLKFLEVKIMITSYKQLENLIRKYGEDFSLEKALELAKAGDLND